MTLVHFARRRRLAPIHVNDIDRSEPTSRWNELARRKGYKYYGRNPRKRTTVYLQCRTCASLMAVHTHTLRTAQPECTPC